MEINRYLHDAVFNYLIKLNEKNPNFRFRIRRSNRYDRLSKGFWFHGNEEYLALSFWSGSDWKNKTPNIFFLFNSDRDIFLILSAKDSLPKTDFFVDSFYRRGKGGFSINNERKVEHYSGEPESILGISFYKKLKQKWNIENIDKILQTLITKEKPIIDTKLTKWNKQWDLDLNNPMGPIDPDDFNKLKEKALRYKEILKNEELLRLPFAGTTETLIVKYSKEFDAQNEKLKRLLNELPISIENIKVTKYKELENIEIPLIPRDKQWVFITGENGAGKSSLLEAIAIGLNGNIDGNTILCANEFNIEIKGNHKTSRFKNSISQKNEPNLKVNEIACYGPNRFDISSSPSTSFINQSSKTYNLFNSDGKLLNIEEEFVQWDLKLSLYFEEKLRIGAENSLKKFKPKYSVEKVLYDKYSKYAYLFQVVKDVLLGEDAGGGKLNKGFLPDIINFDIDPDRSEGKFKYVRGDSKETKLSFSQLSTGNKSLMAMAGDIICRFLPYADPKSQSDPSDFSGIVLIDEIDAHVHPKWQKEIPSLLSEAFPKIQFIVTCHSPIPLLGFEDLTRVNIYKMSKDEDHKPQINEIKVDLEKLTPNTILTSPIFDFDNTLSLAFSKEKGFTSYEKYEEYVFDKMLKAKLSEMEQKFNNEGH